ncbi:MAG: glutamate racemase [Planctomycetia bacterium]|nr:glutamate racemase [Planctomycetia bacterium]
MSNQNPIGVFDSGLGGLTVVKAIRNVLPNESIIYFGDTARVPYGNKSPELIKEYSLQITEFLLEHNTKIIVVACNTATALAIDILQEKLDIPIIGVVKPGVASALKLTQNNRIGVIGTISTISSGAYETELKSNNNFLKVMSNPCPLFVPLAEEGWLNEHATKLIAQKYLEPINKANVDTLILGCTHYPLLKEVIQEVVSTKIKLVDSAQAMAYETKKLLTDYRLLNDQNNKGALKLFVSDLPARFEIVASRFLGEKISNVEKIQLG